MNAITLTTVYRTALLVAALGAVIPASASTFVFDTPDSAVSFAGNPVSAQAIFVVDGNQLQITLTNRTENTLEDGQTINMLSFSINQVVFPTMITSLAVPINIASGGAWTYDVGGNHYEPTKWNLASETTASSTDFLFCNSPDLGACTSGGSDFPERNLIGPPDANNLYANANPSITGGAHEPVLQGTATFTVTLPSNVDASHAIVSNVSFGFGTSSSYRTYNGIPVPLELPGEVPEPGTIGLMGIGSLVLGAGILRHRHQK